MAVVEYERHGRVAVITLNRPEFLNAINQEMTDLAAEAFMKFENDASAKAAVLTGTGKAFSVGLDLKEALADGLDNIKQPIPKCEDVFIEDLFTKPVIAAVNGLAVGGGLYMAMKADMIVASEKAAFQLGEVQRGMVIGIQPSKHSIMNMNLTSAACAEILCGFRIGADRALALGMVNKVVPNGLLLEEALKMAGEIASAEAPSHNLELWRRKRRLGRAISADIERMAEEYAAICMASDDLKESSKAFLEKRRPVYSGK